MEVFKVTTEPSASGSRERCFADSGDVAVGRLLLNPEYRAEDQQYPGGGGPKIPPSVPASNGRRLGERRFSTTARASSSAGCPLPQDFRRMFYRAQVVPELIDGFELAPALGIAGDPGAKTHGIELGDILRAQPRIPICRLAGNGRTLR